MFERIEISCQIVNLWFRGGGRSRRRRWRTIDVETSGPELEVDLREQWIETRLAVPGRVYRYEATDASHEWMFHQMELLAIDEGLSMRHMKGALTQLTQALFGADRPVRFRCDYFPFVEPGAEFGVQCGLCSGAGCRSCGNEGWLEIGGAGMVHREILENLGYDADRYTGFAAGFGIKRI